ncbi:MAG: hypothetical protein IKX00_02185 [Bacilli bacterium]|nr:hypothetical protein [Bacilli bacterium]
MNKILKYVKYTLYVVSVCLFITFVIRYKLKLSGSFDTQFTLGLALMIVLLLVTLTLNIITDVKKKKISNLNGYNFLTIMNLLTLIFIYGRTIFDKNIVSNVLRGIAYDWYNIYGYKYCLFYSNFISLLFVLNIIYFIANAKTHK